MRSKFKVGDVLRIREWDDMASEFEASYAAIMTPKYAFVANMRYMCGEVFTVASINGCRYKSVEGIEGHFAVVGEMLEEYEPDDDMFVDETGISLISEYLYEFQGG